MFRVGHHMRLLILRLATASTAAVFGAAAVAWLWPRPGDSQSWQALLLAGGFTLTTGLGVVCRRRARSAAWLNALDAYAAREIAQMRPRKALKKRPAA